MTQLLSATERDVIDARPRIVARPPEQLQPSARLVDLEHARMHRTMQVQAAGPAPATPGVRQRGSAKAGTPPVVVDTSQNHRIPDTAVQGVGIEPWGQTDYLQALIELADELDMPLADCARRFGTVTLPKNDNGCRFHPALGFTKAKL